jgi:hypothetical protein
MTLSGTSARALGFVTTPKWLSLMVAQIEDLSSPQLLYPFLPARIPTWPSTICIAYRQTGQLAPRFLEALSGLLMRTLRPSGQFHKFLNGLSTPGYYDKETKAQIPATLLPCQTILALRSICTTALRRQQRVPSAMRSPTSMLALNQLMRLLLVASGSTVITSKLCLREWVVRSNQKHATSDARRWRDTELNR